jgi:NitT/TauT family transport system substrate-binding protein
MGRKLIAALMSIAATLFASTAASADAGAVSPQLDRPLAVFGAPSVIELASVRLALRDFYPGGTPPKPGGVASLADPALDADAATNAETQLLRQSLTRPDLRIVMTVAEGRYRIVARRSAGIAALADLKGKRIATFQFTSAGYFLHRMLEKAGLEDGDVTWVPVSPLAEMAGQLARHEVDAVAIWEPHAENAVHALGDDAIVFSGENTYRELFNLNTTASRLADPAARTRIVNLLRAIIGASAELNNDPREAQALVAQETGYTLAEVAACWPHQAFTAGFADDMLDVLEREEAWLAGHDGRAPRSRAELARLIDRGAYEEALRLGSLPRG